MFNNCSLYFWNLNNYAVFFKGYSVTSGYFEKRKNEPNAKEWVASGAPRHNLKGAVS